MKKLRVWMRKNGYNQEKLAKELDISTAYMSLMLRGKKGITALLIGKLNRLTRGEVPPDYMIRYMERRDRELRKAANE